ncbi:hypothetical protein ACFV1L_07705 [Kitasatospora sp. NPDC059646]|uniref:hypothetical protein n=1 Tax=Kitasatospora TaxID=2063 RepID=UPI0005682EE4|nr:hypothetical protein [Kitasatospora cheerisanensis]
MHPIPLLCPRCGEPQTVVHSDDPHHPIRVLHTETGREECDLAPDGTPPAGRPESRTPTGETP